MKKVEMAVLVCEHFVTPLERPSFPSAHEWGPTSRTQSSLGKARRLEPLLSEWLLLFSYQSAYDVTCYPTVSLVSLLDSNCTMAMPGPTQPRPWAQGQREDSAWPSGAALSNWSQGPESSWECPWPWAEAEVPVLGISIAIFSGWFQRGRGQGSRSSPKMAWWLCSYGFVS